MASAIIRSVAVHSRPTTFDLTDCICLENGVSSVNSSPYRPTQLPPVAPYKPPSIDDESFNFGDSKTHTPHTPLCACLNCAADSTLCFDSFQSDVVSTSTSNATFDLEKENIVNNNQLSPIVEYTSLDEDAAALGNLSKKQSPLFGRKNHSTSKTYILSQSFSLRTEEPVYTQQILIEEKSNNGTEVQKQPKDQRRIDLNAVEAINMSSAAENGGIGSPTNFTVVNRNNGQTRNGTIMTSANAEKREHLYKILVIGELGTGKTSFIKRYVHQFFSQNYRATIGVDFALKVLHWDANTTVRLQLWDIAGQERFGNMTRVYYKEAVGAFIVFDVTRSGTFECVSKWKEDLDSKVQLPDGSPIPCILLANKCDQEKQGIVTSPEKMDEYVQENGFAGWYETSAKENINIDEAARALVNKILLNDRLISDADLADSDKFNLNNSGEQTTSSGKSKCSC
ncbi:ras-related protein Rab-32B isoform X2 [Anastrepha ludens]|uniref:ras-related protein Rab-32B isoform X2 n=1 Tax=Anastrepha ludens TaxID=28586 RepID=UPI0023B0D193|nr:ras-related protein Rab-32B isoform X2 [Anastrepha ludens]XP_053966610.1 ras-related protein Rab-32B isoform X2 [Anastrepha ludens]XP_053966611.1 ras-related protein Rab-32B isoform X2 [Anastrepha ludens]